MWGEPAATHRGRQGPDDDPAETHCGGTSGSAAISASRRSACSQVSATQSRTEWGTSVIWRSAPSGSVCRTPPDQGGKTPDCPGEGPVVELVPGVEVEEATGRADAEDAAGRELERVGGDVGKVPEPGAGVVTSGAPPVVAGRL